MQRQSLGSPAKLAGAKDDAVLKADNESRQRDLSLSPASATAGDEEIKPLKPFRSHVQSEKFVHLIPVLLLFCFVVLYLSSHDPSSEDLAQFNGFKRHERLVDSSDIDEIGGVQHQLEIGTAFATRSMRNLKEEIQSDVNPKSNSHRKLSDF